MTKHCRTASALSLVLILSLGVCADAAQKKPRKPKDVADISAVLDRQVAAWNRRDLDAFMQGYWRAPELSFYSDADRVFGWQPTLDRYRKRYQSEGREMGQLTFSDLEIELLGPGGAFVRGRWRLKMSSGEPNGQFTLIFRKIDNEWKIVHDHTSSAPQS